MDTIDNKNIFLPNLRDLIRKLPQILLLYFFIFQPQFISRTSYFLLEFVVFILFIICKPILFLNTFNKFKNESLLFILIILYTILRDLFKLEVVYSFKIILWFFQAFLFPIIIVANFNDKKKENESYPDLFSLSYWVVIIAAFFSFFLLINEPFNNLYKSLIVIDPNTIRYNIRLYRGYGIAENLTFTYSYVLGIIAGYTLYILNKRWWYIIFFPFIIIGVIFNARIGLLPVFIFFFLLFLKRRQNIKVLLVIIFFSLGVILLLPKLGIFKYLDHNKEWITSFFSGPTIRTLLSDFIILPSRLIDWVFGSGVNLFLSNPGMPNSDIGYINQLNYGGVFFLILLFLLFVYMVIRLKINYGMKNWFVIVFTLSILFLNFKGSTFASTPGSRFLFMFYIYVIDLTFKE